MVVSKDYSRILFITLDPAIIISRKNRQIPLSSSAHIFRRLHVHQ